MDQRWFQSIFITLWMSLAVLQCLAQGPDNRDWYPPRQPRIYRSGEVTTFHTHGKDNMRQVWYQVEDRTSILFGVMTCEDAIVLISARGNLDVDDYEAIKIGAEGNTKTVLVSNDGTVLASEDTPSVLECDTVQYFWMDWRNNYMAIGLGRKIGEELLLSYFEPDWNLRVMGIGFTSDTDKGANWVLRENSGDTMVFFTKEEKTYGNFWKSVSSRSWYTFQVKACSDAHVLLTSAANRWDGDVYEIVLGGLANTQNFIKSRALSTEPSHVKATSPGAVLNCDEFKDFWISWLGGIIQVGRGSIHGHNVLLTYQDTNPLAVRDLGVLTSGPDDAQWIFTDSLQSITTFQTYGSEDKPKYWLEVPHVFGIKFSVTACDQISLYLSDSEGGDPDFSYIIDIYAEDDDGSGNRISGIRSPFAPGYIEKSPTPKILDCNGARDFWVGWRNGMIQLGSGKVFGRNQVFQGIEVEKEEHKTQVIGFYTPASGQAAWTLPESSGHQLRFATTAAGVDTWHTVQAQRELHFAVKTTSGARLYLTPTTGFGTYAKKVVVTLGSGGDNASTIAIEGPTGVKELQRADTTRVVRPDVFHDYWISWGDGKIQVGAGPIVGESTFMGVRNELLERVHTVAFDGGESPAEFIIPEDPGDVLMVTTTGEADGYDHGIALDEGITWLTFSAQACSDLLVLIGTGEGATEIGVAIGGTTNFIRVVGETDYLANTTSSGELSCKDAREFWVSWKDGHIQIGHGILYQQSFSIVEYRGAQLSDIPGISFTTTNEVMGTWIFRQNIAPRGYFFTVYHGVKRRGITRTLDHHRNMVFGVKACTRLSVLLTDEPTVETDRSYLVNIGDNRNSEINVIQGYRNRQSRESVPGILSCAETRHFWMTWDRASLTIGRGEVIGEDILMDYAGVRGAQMRAASFYSSLPGPAALWDIPMYEGFFTPINSTDIPTRKPPVVEPESSGGLHAGQVIGIIIGVLLVLTVIAAVVLVVLHKKDIIVLPVLSGVSRFENES